MLGERMNHGTKFVVGLVALLVALCAGIYGGLALYQDRAVDQDQTDVNETADVVATQVNAAVAEKEDSVGLMASRPAARDFDFFEIPSART